MPRTQVTIVGGGISGLAAAYYLTKHGIRPTLIEKEPRVGGLIRTDRIDGCDLEAGPDSFIASKPELRELAVELGIEDRIIPSNDARRRVFLARDGALTPMPPGMIMMAPSDLVAALRSRFFSARTKLRFLREWFAKPRQRPGDVSVGDFVRDHFGDEVLELVAEPLLTGVYGGTARDLGMESVLPRFLNYERDYGSVIRGARQEQKGRKPGVSLFQSFAGGMQTVVDALQQQLTPHMDLIHTEATHLSRTDATWRVLTLDGPYDAEHVILAVPAFTAGTLLESTVPEASAMLNAIPYSSAILVTDLFAGEHFDHPLDGFGFLISQSQRTTIAASTWISTKFPSRVAPGRVALRSFIVGEEALALEKADDRHIAKRVQEDLRRWMSLEAEPLQTLVTRWPHSMPQYSVGHSGGIAQLAEILAAFPGLHLCGNAYGGVGIPDCIRMARKAADRVGSKLNAVRQ